MGKKGEKSRVNLREIVLDALLSIERGEAYSHVVIGGVLDKYNYLEIREKAFIKRLTEGTLERRLELDYCINTVSSVPTPEMKPLIRELLRMSAYQILFMDAMPDSAVCNEAVKLAGRRGFGALQGFVNGVLRGLCRKKGQIPWPDREKERLSWLSVRYSMPKWLIEKWDREQGTGKTEAILSGLLKERPVAIRLRGDMKEQEREALRMELEQSGIRVRQERDLACAWYLEKTEGMRAIPSFVEGRFTVQDISSMLAVEAAGIRPGDYVMDLCAAPGGKALLAAERTGPEGTVLAGDINGMRLALVKEAAERMGLKNITVRQWDAGIMDESKREAADVVLADVPCSGLGVIGRKRDIKYRITREAIEKLLPLQRGILKQAWQYVKPGGVLLYSTCTISRAENEDMRAWFLQHFPFHEESLVPYLPPVFRTESAQEGYVQLLPGIHGTDGFFMARLIRDE